MQRLIRQTGASMIETMLYMGAVVGFAAVAMTVFSDQTKKQKSAEMKNEHMLLVDQIKATLADTINCTETFRNLPRNGSVTAIKLDRGGSFEDVHKVDARSPTGLAVKSYKLEPLSTSGPNQTALRITISRGKMANPDEVSKLVKLELTLDASSNIQSCFAVTDSDTIWVRSTVQTDSILYNHGSVGIGSSTVISEAGLSVNGEIKLSSGGPCTTDKVGAIAYDSTIKELVICSAVGWGRLQPAMRGPFSSSCSSGSYSTRVLPLGKHSICGLNVTQMSNMGRDDHFLGECRLEKVGDDWFLHTTCDEGNIICGAICF